MKFKYFGPQPGYTNETRVSVPQQKRKVHILILLILKHLGTNNERTPNKSNLDLGFIDIRPIILVVLITQLIPFSKLGSQCSILSVSVLWFV